MLDSNERPGRGGEDGCIVAARSNACSELVRLWLEARHGFLVGEGIPVPVPYALSDIDLIAMHPIQQARRVTKWLTPVGRIGGRKRGAARCAV